MNILISAKNKHIFVDKLMWITAPSYPQNGIFLRVIHNTSSLIIIKFMRRCILFGCFYKSIINQESIIELLKNFTKSL